MAKTLKERNRMECNVRARAKYDAENYKHIGIKFKNSEYEALEKFCSEKGLPKNGVVRQALMEYIERHSEE